MSDLNKRLEHDYKAGEVWNDRRAKAEEEGVNKFWEAYAFWNNKRSTSQTQ